jgi:hypothetical protein
MEKLRVGKKPTAVSPFSTGGGGVRFELLVAVHYMIALLRREVPRGVPDGVVQEIRLQQRNRNCPVDDIVVACKSSVSTSSLYLQVKHDITFGKNEPFIEVVSQAWQQLSSKGFHVGSDAVGLAIGEVCNNSTVKNHIAGPNGLIAWSRFSSSGQSFYAKARKFKKKRDLLEAFEEGIASAICKKPTQDDVYKLLSHFVVVPFDFDLRAGRDTIENSNALISSVANGDTRNAGSLGAILYDMAAEYAQMAGEIDRSDLSKRISTRASFAVPVLQRAGRAISEILLTRLHNRLASEKNSKKYIPNIFVEVGDVKDEARLFCHPELFLHKLVDDVRRLDLFDLNRFLTKAGLPGLAVDIPNVGTYETIEADVVAIREALSKLSTSLSKFTRKNIAAFRGLVPVDRKHIFDEVDWRIGDTAHALVDYEMTPLFKRLDCASARILAIVSKAGQGKTNFVCNLAEHCLAKRGIPCAYFTGKELRTVGRKQLQGFIARLVYGEAFPGNLEDLLEEIDCEARRQGTAGIILIDAINEHPDLPVFTQEIEELIEKCLQYSRIRVILTCRSEYFDARFGNLGKSSFADRLVIQREIHQRMTEEHRRRMIQGYFHFFKLDVPWMSNHARKQFGEDPFLLRMFCEAYGNPVAKGVRKMGRLRNIRRDALFREYFKQKLGALKERTSQKTGFLLGNRHPYQEVIRKAIQWMVDSGRYADVPLTFFKEKELGTLSSLVDEDILIRRDLTADSVIGSKEVLNFTFDACRDFLLSDYLLNVLAKQDRQRFEKLVIQLTDPKQSVAEGLQQYLFYASRYLADPPTTTFIDCQPWYETIFITSVFDLDEETITKQDADRLKGFCLNGHQLATRIVVDFLVRYDPRQYPNANILTLFEMFDSMDPIKFKDLCGRTFGARDYGARGGYYPIDRLTKDVERLLLSTGDHWVSSYATLGRLMLYLWRMPGPQHTYPARDLFERFAEVHPATASRLEKEHRNQSRKIYSDRLLP